MAKSKAQGRRGARPAETEDAALVADGVAAHTVPSTPRTTSVRAPGLPPSRPPSRPHNHPHHRPTSQAKRRAKHSPASRRERVLIIDDEPQAAEAVAQAFADAEVTVCLVAAEGLARAEDEPWDLILCDMMMPGLTGQDVYERLAASAPDKLERVVFVTGGGFTPEIHAFLDERGPRLLSKPASLADLRALLA